MTYRTEENTVPSDTNYHDIELLGLIVEAGEKYQQAQQTLRVTTGIYDELWLGPVAVMFADECVGYFVSEDGRVNFHDAEYANEPE